MTNSQLMILKSTKAEAEGALNNAFQVKKQLEKKLEELASEFINCVGMASTDYIMDAVDEVQEELEIIDEIISELKAHISSLS